MDYLLVHGSTQSPACWRRVAEPLTAGGHRVFTADLPLDRPDWLAADYARVVGEQAAGAVNPVLVGHSAAGMLLPAIADVVAPRHLVWLAAVVPDFAGGRSFLAEVNDPAGAVVSPEWHTWTAGLDEAREEAAYFLFHDCDLETLRWAMTTLRLFRAAAVANAPAAATPPAAPSTYLLPTDDRTLTPTWMRQAARTRLNARLVEFPGDHCPHTSHPTTVTEVLLALTTESTVDSD